MTSKYRTLRTISGIIRFSALLFLALSLFDTIGSITKNYDVLAGFPILTILGAILMNVVIALGLYAFGEVLLLLISIDDNTKQLMTAFTKRGNVEARK